MAVPSLADAISPTIPRVAFVSGAAHRIGRAIAHALAEAGFAVAVHYRASAAAADALAADLRAHGVATATFAGDLAEEADVARLIGAATAALGPLGVLVNNASSFARDDWATADAASWHFHLAPNLRAPFVLTQDFARALPAGAEGVVVNLLDARVLAPGGTMTTYTLSKCGLWALTRMLAQSLAPRIRVAGIGPGPALPSTLDAPGQFAADAAALPLRRPTSPDEIARAVLMILALPSFTGQMLALDGGLHLGAGA